MSGDGVASSENACLCSDGKHDHYEVRPARSPSASSMVMAMWHRCITRTRTSVCLQIVMAAEYVPTNASDWGSIMIATHVVLLNIGGASIHGKLH
jgi:hypothetical protein